MSSNKPMPLARALASIFLTLALSACSRQPSAEPPSQEGTMASASPNASSPWQAKLGQRITLEGVAEDAKLGALLLIGDSESIWIDGLDFWPAEIRGKRVQVTGKVIERADLPVFIEREGEPVMQGIPMPPGTDLERARRRYLLAETQWKLTGAGH